MDQTRNTYTPAQLGFPADNLTIPLLGIATLAVAAVYFLFFRKSK